MFIEKPRRVLPFPIYYRRSKI